MAPSALPTARAAALGSGLPRPAPAALSAGARPRPITQLASRWLPCQLPGDPAGVSRL